MRRTTSAASAASARSVLRNLRRAGVAKNRSRLRSPFLSTRQPSWTADLTRLDGDFMRFAAAAKPRRYAQPLMEPTDGRASPRKPKNLISIRSSLGSFDVA